MIWIAVIAMAIVAMARIQAPLSVWTTACAAILLLVPASFDVSPTAMTVLWVIFILAAVLLNVPVLRRRLISDPMLRRIRKLLPPMSDTEKTALDAGTVWWETELFRGQPDFNRLLNLPAARLTAEEQAFIDGPVDTLCSMLDDWQITHELNDLPPQVWEFLKRERFFGMIIPKQYGGLEFSPLAHSAVIMKVFSRSSTAGVTVMVPNSLGPAELLLQYGTPAQKDHYLPRLASGEDIPCFALTAPSAGSDAGAIPDSGIICHGEIDGQRVLGLRLNWDKRYITLGPVATVLGLAFKTWDPDHLLGEDEELGITCALIPTDTPGVVIGNRHLPLNAAFQNGPNQGHDVFVPLDAIIGGRDGIGQGWRMLVECLAAGRGISLPASGTSAGKMASRHTGAYARIRRQFRLPIARFEGVEEVLARIGGLTYLADAGRLMTATALHEGEKPSVVTAILKYHLTENMRQVLNDAMDIHGGRGICMGPSNYLARAYQAIPVSITVEGANILTRTMIIFGQGAIRCHPWLLTEMHAAQDPDPAAGSLVFDRALVSHAGYAIGNCCRALLYGITNGMTAPQPVTDETSVYFRQLARLSAAYAFLSDIALLVLGGALKRKEKLSGRFADGLGHMYLCAATLKHFHDTGRPAADLPLLHWAAQHSLFSTQEALDGILRNFPNRVIAAMLRVIVFPLGRRLRPPGDKLGRAVADIMISPSETRDRLTAGIYISNDPDDITGRLEHALALVIASEPIERRLRQAGEVQPPLTDYTVWVASLHERSLISPEEAHTLRSAEAATRAVIAVDDFPPESVAVKKSQHQAA